MNEIAKRGCMVAASNQRHSIPSIAFAVVLLLLHDSSGALLGQTAIPTSQQLDQLLAPIALYPDTLLAQITTASTNPQEILDVDDWLRQKPYLSGDALQSAAEQQGFDPAFIALVNFPQILDMMAQNIDDYAAIGAAFSANQGLVMDSIQRLRAQAYAAGALQTNQQQQVLTQNQGGQQIILIQPTNPQVVYVPMYDPTLVYTRPSTGALVASALLTFGAGITIGALLNDRPWGWGGWGWNWGHRNVIMNRNPWVFRNNHYRPPRYTHRPRPIAYNNRPGYGGNWSYRPPNYRPPSVNRPPNYRPPVGNRPPNNGSNRPPNYGRPPGNSSATNRPPAPQPSPNSPPPPRPPNNRPGPNASGGPPPNPGRPVPNARPSQPARNPFAGYQPNRGGENAQAQTGGRASVFNSNNRGGDARAASNRGRQSMSRSRE